MYVRTVEREAFIGPPKVATELRLQQCTWCATIVLRTSLLCPACASTELRWVRSEGRGKVCSAVEVRRKGQRPRMVAVVDLGDGIRLRATVEGAPAGTTPYGAPVTVREIAPDGLPVFRVDPPSRSEDR
ncbi:OB-fold domain-containing protein [Streptomyces flaveolus]|uniref:Zn-ribbon domain-containing OB-fold protein n=1 Tax=Streptomyces flaveolus TaxID=67297 RepID=UPI0033336F2D